MGLARPLGSNDWLCDSLIGAIELAWLTGDERPRESARDRRCCSARITGPRLHRRGDGLGKSRRRAGRDHGPAARGPRTRDVRGLLGGDGTVRRAAVCPTKRR